MDLRELVAKQRSFDKAHGWCLSDEKIGTLLRGLSDDIVGLAGEFGEFANLVKKLNLLADRDERDAEVELERVRASLGEELADTFIYLMRLVTHLEVDLEAAYLAKLEQNRERYKNYKVDGG